MAAEEPETKKFKSDSTEEQTDPIFDQFRSNKNEMFKLKYALDALKLGLGGSKLCMMKITAVNACAPVSFSMASVETRIHTSMERDDGVTADGFAVGSIFTDGIFILENYINSGALPKNQELRMTLAKLLKYLSETGEYSFCIYGKCSKIWNTCCLPQRPRQTGQTLIRLLLKKQSDQRLPCLLF